LFGCHLFNHWSQLRYLLLYPVKSIIRTFMLLELAWSSLECVEVNSWIVEVNRSVLYWFFIEDMFWWYHSLVKVLNVWSVIFEWLDISFRRGFWHYRKFFFKLTETFLLSWHGWNIFVWYLSLNLSCHFFIWKNLNVIAITKHRFLYFVTRRLFNNLNERWSWFILLLYHLFILSSIILIQH